jgi:hypothetical protein
MTTASFHIADHDRRVAQEVGYLICCKGFCSFVMRHDQAAAHDLSVYVSIRNDQITPTPLLALDAGRIGSPHCHGENVSTGVEASMI